MTWKKLKSLLLFFVCLFCLIPSSFAQEYEVSDSDLLAEGYANTVIFMNENIVYIDGNYYSYYAYIGDISRVGFPDCMSRYLYEWNQIFYCHTFFDELPTRPDTTIWLRTADGETFDSLPAAMHHIMGYLARGETMPVLVDLDD